MPDPDITPEVIKEHGITPEEYEHILEILGREPNYTELGIFSVMWSEHCSYKNTRSLLKTFPTRSPKVIVAAVTTSLLSFRWIDINLQQKARKTPKSIHPKKIFQRFAPENTPKIFYGAPRRKYH